MESLHYRKSNRPSMRLRSSEKQLQTHNTSDLAAACVYRLHTLIVATGKGPVSVCYVECYEMEEEKNVQDFDPISV